MSSRSNKRQTLAKLARERAVKERRTRKQAKKDERKEAQLAGPADPSQSSSRIVPVAEGSAATAFTGEARLTRNVSGPSLRVSPVT